jgi:hypothetical protein
MFTHIINGKIYYYISKIKSEKYTEKLKEAKQKKMSNKKLSKSEIKMFKKINDNLI